MGEGASEGPSVALGEVVEALRAQGVEVPDRARLGWYGDNAQMAAELGALIREGVKTATAGLLWDYEADGAPLPRPGDVELVVDFEGRFLAMVETTHVEVIPFDEVSAEHARAEGEGDGSLGFWREAHWRFFTRRCAALGREVDGAMPVVCERFRLLHPRAQAIGEEEGS